MYPSTAAAMEMAVLRGQASDPGVVHLHRRRPPTHTPEFYLNYSDGNKTTNRESVRKIHIKPQKHFESDFLKKKKK